MTDQKSTTVHSSALGQAALLGVITKRAYRLVPGKLGVGSPAALMVDPLYRELDEDDHALVIDSDLFCLHKQTTDVVLTGTAYSHRGVVTELHTALVVGSVRKEVLVTGDRSLQVRADGSLSATPPQRFERMALGWSRAYGGRDRGSEPAPPAATRSPLPSVEALLAQSTHAYPRNRAGTGFFVDQDRQRLDGKPLPNLSDPGDPVELSRLLAADPCDWLDRPGPASYGPVGALTFPRCLWSGIGLQCSQRSRPVREVALGALHAHEVEQIDHPEPAQARAFNCAPPGLSTAQLTGREQVQLWNLHPGAEHYCFALPAERPRLLLEPPKAGTFELQPKLATVFIEPDEERLTLTWAGTTPAAGIYSPEQCAKMRHAVTWS